MVAREYYDTTNANVKEIDTEKYFLDVAECVFELNVSVHCSLLTDQQPIL